MLQLKTFGGLWLTGGDPRLDGREGLRRQLLLLALVAESGERGVSRDRAITFFWPDGDEERGRHSLNQLRYTLRRELGADPLIGTRTLRIDPAFLSSDVAEFTAAVAAGDADHAAGLYAGPFLDGVFAEGSAELEAMIEERRLALRRALEGALGGAARAAEGRGDWSLAVGYWRRLVGLDPLSTGFAIGLMSALAESDDAPGALLAAADHEAAVRRELETAPDARVTALVSEIRRSTRAIRRDTPAPAAKLDTSGPAAVPAPAVRVSSPATIGPSGPAPRRWSVAISAGIGGAAVVIALGALLSFHRSAPAVDPNQVLVTPFENRTGDSALTSIGAMAADWITQGIVDDGAAPVVAPISARSALQEADSLAERGSPRSRLRLLAEETGAGLVVTGAYDRVGDSLSFEVQLSDPLTGRVIGALSPIRSGLTDPSAALTELRQRVVGALRVRLNPVAADPTGQRASRPPTPAAYRRFLAAQAVNAEYHYDDAIRMYREAYLLDTTFLTPIASIAMNYFTMGEFFLADSVLEEAKRRESRMQTTDRLSLENTRAELAGDRMAALHTAEESRRIMPGSESDVYYAQDLLRVNRVAEAIQLLRGVDPARGWLRNWSGYWALLAAAYHLDGDIPAALEVAQEGRRRFPGSSHALASEVAERAALGQVGEVKRQVAQWLSGNPKVDWGLYSVLTRPGLELRVHGHAEEGRQFAVEALDTLRWLIKGDTSWDTRGATLELLCQAEQWAEASALARVIEAEYPTDPDGQGYLGVTAARMGDSLAASAAQQLLASRPYPYTFGRSLVWQARIAAVRQHPERAVALIRAAIRAGYYDLWTLHRMPEFESLRSYPPYVALLKPAG